MHSEELDDYFGMESCTDFRPEVAEIVSRGGAGKSRARHSRRSKAAVTEYPPPIPMLVRAENLPSQMPWVMKKHRTSDGRLVITEERASRREYFQVHRSNGRLVLNLIPVNDDDEEGGEELRAGEGEEKLGFPGNVAASQEDIDGWDKRIVDPPAAEEVYIGAEPCGGFGVAMAGLTPPVHT
ncbi:hypothetical protein C2S53_013822 [Perilla frutescens var. hirtella]|uniref:FAF domain-containing protein n=1 Tax=Perilla frutescens var. hirtella TaxID=608512 RepID=A0AAD4J740_PERFH|nr:hypothetical protein C2S53_013822 [Perilla frutescens var. hirtella]